MAAPWKTFSTLGLGALVLMLTGASGDGCGGSPLIPDPEKATTVRLDFANTEDFYASPFPSQHRRREDGTVDMSAWPNPDGITLADQIAAIVSQEADGFGTTSGVYFTTTKALDPASLPAMRDTLKSDAAVFVMSVEPGAVDEGTRYPVKVDFQEDGGPFGAANLLTILPYQGVPLRPETTYVAVVRTSVKDASGEALGMAPELGALLAGQAVEGLDDANRALYRDALVRLSDHGVPAAEVAGLAVFRTGNPTATFAKVLDDALSRPLPEPVKAFEPAEVFDDYCVFQTTIKMPTYQAGAPPYDTEGGGWAFDEKGQPVVQAEEEAHFVVTLPRAPMPEKGFPVVVFSRTGAGGDRPLVERGVRGETGEVLVPGTGPAQEFAQVGWAGSMIDGPHGGLRNVSGKDEQFLVFNVFNPLALRDNVRQSALELVLQAHLLESIEVDASSCPGLTTPGGGAAKLDVSALAAFGHSMGASIVPLAVAFEPRIKGAILSGAGSSYIANILYKKAPIETKGFAELILKYAGKRELTEFDPVMSVLQWAAEPADTQAYARSILKEPSEGAEHHVLMVEGVVDHYILPPIANSTALCLGLDLGGPELTADSEELATFDALSSVLDLEGRAEVTLPAKGNVKRADGGASTAVVVQHPEDGVEDGHEAVFQTEAPKHQYRCFLQSLAKGTPSVPPAGPISASCE